MTAARILEVIALAEEEPDVSDVIDYLSDVDPGVRRAAVDVLSETTPPGVERELARALGDPDASVRRAAAEGLRELEDILAVDPVFVDLLDVAASGSDPFVREVVLGVLRATRSGDRSIFTAALRDAEVAVRVEAIRGLVSLHAVEDVSRGASDPVHEVRIAVARGLGTLGDPVAVPVILELTTDADPLVRAAAFEAAPGVREVAAFPALATSACAALEDSSWEVRRGAATALGAANADVAVDALIDALEDVNLDVRKAAVRSLARWSDKQSVRTALARALDDSDADVRAYARLAVGRTAVSVQGDGA